MNKSGHILFGCIVISMLAGGLAFAKGLTFSGLGESILQRFNVINKVASTIPANGDLNPYGVAIIPNSIGNLKEGHILVSNFNNSANLQGTGSTITDIAQDGTANLFTKLDANSLPGQCPGGIGLTTALVALRSGWVIVGSLPTKDGTAATAQSGCLIVLDNTGKPVETFFGSLINGPWDMTAFETDDEVKLFVTNVLNGTVAANGQVVNQGTVIRLNLKLPKNSLPFLESITVIGSEFPERTDPAALVIGPTGVGFSTRHHCEYSEQNGDSGRRREGVLYVADSLSNRIAVIPNALERTTSAGIGETLSTGGSLDEPLGLVVTPNGHILTVNGNDGFIVEITPHGHQISETLLDNTGGQAPGAGTLFGLAFDEKVGVFFVDDGTNTLNLLH